MAKTGWGILIEIAIVILDYLLSQDDKKGDSS
jgi:hypothetical protein